MNRIAVAGLIAGAVALVTVPVAVVAADRDDTGGAPGPVAPSSTSPTESPETSTAPAPEATSSPSDRPEDPFTPAAYDDWRTTVPADLVVSEGLPADGGDFERSADPVREPFCGTDAFPVEGVTDARRDGATGPEFADLRDLRVYADDAAAHALLVAAREAVQACPEDEFGATRWLSESTDVDLGDESVRIVRTYETDGLVNAGATFWHLVRVGNAVLVAAQSGEWLPGENLGQGIAGHERMIAPIIEGMCAFGTTGCAAPVDIPDDFPLAAGWPDDDVTEPGPRYGLLGPNRSLEPLAWDLCEGSLTATDVRDRLRADWNNVEDSRARELVTFDDAEAAVAFTGAMVALWRDCPRQEHGDGYETVNDVRRTAVGGESWALVTWAEYEGAPAVGLRVVHVTRLGRAVLIDQSGNEGSRAYADEQVEEQIATTGSVVAAMCRFTEAGC
ncbi:MAG: hypothetical protein ACRDO4_10290 [Nocardioides sp.]